MPPCTQILNMSFALTRRVPGHALALRFYRRRKVQTQEAQTRLPRFGANWVQLAAEFVGIVEQKIALTFKKFENLEDFCDAEF